jgi:hypothetical protein
MNPIPDVAKRAPSTSNTTSRLTVIDTAAPHGRVTTAELQELQELLEAVFPDADFLALRQTADGLLRRISGPELDLEDLTDDEEDVLQAMPPRAWAVLRQHALAEGGAGIVSVILAPELSSGGQKLVEGLREIGPKSLFVSVPANGVINFGDRDGQRTERNFQLPEMSVRHGPPGTPLQAIYVPDGTSVVGLGGGMENVQVYFTDSTGAVLKSRPLYCVRDKAAEAVEAASVHSRAAFVEAAKQCSRFPTDALETLFDRLVGCISPTARRLDLSACTGQDARDVLDLPQSSWEALRRHPKATDLIKVIVSPDLSLREQLVNGLLQVAAVDPSLPPRGAKPLATIQAIAVDPDLPPMGAKPHAMPAQVRHAPAGRDRARGRFVFAAPAQTALRRDKARASFVTAAQAALPGRPVDQLFNMLVSRIEGTRLNLWDAFKSVTALQLLPQGAWDAFLSDPAAVNLEVISASDALFNSGPLVALGDKLKIERAPMPA